jgi:D-3-phosphoglycerate dehydrogenase
VEAQVGVATEVVEQVLAVLRGQAASNTVNAPFVLPEADGLVGPFLEVAVDIGKIAIQLAEGQLTNITLLYQGEIANEETGPLRAAVLIGVIQPVTDERVNLVNASLLAQQRGLHVQEDRDRTPADVLNQITVRLTAGGKTVVASGTHVRGRTHVLRVNEYFVDTTVDSPYLLFIENQDRPGVIGWVGTIAGQHDINISFMEVGRLAARGNAMMIVGMDEPVPDSALKEFRAIPGVVSARLVRM